MKIAICGDNGINMHKCSICGNDCFSADKYKMKVKFVCMKCGFKLIKNSKDFEIEDNPDSLIDKMFNKKERDLLNKNLIKYIKSKNGNGIAG